jgi:hypothetical protein
MCKIWHALAWAESGASATTQGHGRDARATTAYSSIGRRGEEGLEKHVFLRNEPELDSQKKQWKYQDGK